MSCSCKPSVDTSRYSPRAKKVHDLALREALAAGDNWIGTQHMLLALARDEDSLASVVLKTLGISVDDVRRVVGVLRDGR